MRVNPGRYRSSLTYRDIYLSAKGMKKKTNILIEMLKNKIRYHASND